MFVRSPPHPCRQSRRGDRLGDEMKGACIYAATSEEAYSVSEDGHLVASVGPMLCGWAHEEAPAALLNVPRWLQRNALAGHLIDYPADCRGCPCFHPRVGE